MLIPELPPAFPPFTLPSIAGGSEPGGNGSKSIASAPAPSANDCVGLTAPNSGDKTNSGDNALEELEFIDGMGSCGRGCVGVDVELPEWEEAAWFIDGRIPTARREASDAGRREAREFIIYNVPHGVHL